MGADSGEKASLNGGDETSFSNGKDVLVRDRLLRTRRLYARAERAIRRTERITLSLVTAPVNQLRYAGCHILRAVEMDGRGEKAKAGENLDKADGHCKRAWLDAFECGVLYLVRSIRSFYDRAAENPMFLERHPEVLTFQDEVSRLEDLFYSSALAQPMTVRERIRIIHAAQRLGRIKREVLRLWAGDSREARRLAKASGGKRESRAQKVARVFHNRQFLVSFSATVCGTILGTICFGMALYDAANGCPYRGWVVCGGVTFAAVLVVLTYCVAQPFLIPPEQREIKRRDGDE